MDFKDKLQILRIKMRLSQEDLAEKLNISRQSVTKWENGQSLPDINKLIQCSELFKVSIDRLVKDNDECNVGFDKNLEYSQQDLRRFLIRAKNSTYVSGENITLSSRPYSHDYKYVENDYTYIDTYLGGEKFIGEEAVWLKDKPIWGMNYYGNTLSSEFNVKFLKEALSHITLENPFRGPECYQRGEYLYNCRVQGDIEHFQGEEIIYCKEKKVYFCVFHGGSILWIII